MYIITYIYQLEKSEAPIRLRCSLLVSLYGDIRSSLATYHSNSLCGLGWGPGLGSRQQLIVILLNDKDDV